MFCRNCGNKLNPNSKFCNNCGTAVFNQANSNPNSNLNQAIFNNQNIQTNKKINSSTGKIITIVSLVVILVMLVGAVIISGNFIPTKKSGKRTIMMYIVGSNLESDSGIITADLAAIDPSKIDLTNTNVLIYTGGTKKWHNFIKNDENAIYLLTSTGFKKIKAYPKTNMGDANTLTDFLNYSYTNYPAGNFNLIMYDHGGAIDGAIYDDFTDDNLSLEDFANALKKSKFNSKNKLQTVLFRTCLNGTLEVADVFKDYAEYLIASEEVTYGAGYSNVLSFVNNITASDDGVNFGKKFISQYKRQMEEIDMFNNINSTYSIIDLSKITNVTNEFNKFISNINLKNNYNTISRIRSTAYQYGNSAESYDMIDLYNFASKVASESNYSASTLLNSIKSAVVFNDSNMKNSYGLSIYFPYKGSIGAKAKFLNVYDKLTNFTNYYNFIRQFSSIQAGNSSFNLNIFTNEIKNDNNVVSIQLTDEQKENFANASYLIFMQDKEHPDYYQFVYESDDTSVDSNGLLKASVENNLIKVSDDTGELMFINVKKSHIDTRESIYTVGILEDPVDDAKSYFESMATAYLYMKEEGNQYKFSTATIKSNNERVDGTFIKIEDFKKIALLRSRYKIFDENGKFIENRDDWGRTPVIEGFDIALDKIILSKAQLDKNEKYYCVFLVTDINNNSYYSNVIEIK